jgi:hypothetical protein
LLAIRTCAHGLADASAFSLALGRRYMEGPLPDPWINNVVGNCMLFAHLMAGRHAEAAAVPWEDVKGDHDARATSTEIYRLCLRGLSCAQRLLLPKPSPVIRRQVWWCDRGELQPQCGSHSMLAHQIYELDR